MADESGISLSGQDSLTLCHTGSRAPKQGTILTELQRFELSSVQETSSHIIS